MEINVLPEDLVNIIKSYISIKFLSLTNKYYWEKNFNMTYESKLQSSYWRFLLRNDINFVFNKYLLNALPYFLKEKRIIYKSQIYPRRLELVNYLINFVFDSQKCKNTLNNFIKKKRLLFKKIRVKLNKWSN